MRGGGKLLSKLFLVSSFISVLTFALSSLSEFVAVLSLFPSRVPWPRNYANLEALLVVHTTRRGSQTMDLNLGC